MPDEIGRIDYDYVTVPNKPGAGERVLAVLREAGINLLGVPAFPHGARKFQLAEEADGEKYEIARDTEPEKADDARKDDNARQDERPGPRSQLPTVLTARLATPGSIQSRRQPRSIATFDRSFTTPDIACSSVAPRRCAVHPENSSASSWGSRSLTSF